MDKLITICLLFVCWMSNAVPINSMLGARNCINSDADKDSPYPLPDNAVAIEYIETTGRTSNANYGQHIVLPLIGSNCYTIEMDIELLYLNVAKAADICSIQVATNNRGIYLRYNISDKQYTIASGPNIRSIDISNTLYARHLFKTEADVPSNEMHLYCDGEMLLTCPNLPNSPLNLYLFACNIGEGNYTRYGARCKCWGVRAWDSSTNKLVMDLVPIRIDDVGYMFDRCTGEVLGNSGTGNFILGPDL